MKAGDVIQGVLVSLIAVYGIFLIFGCFYVWSR